MIYCVDTSAFIAAWIESYPQDVTPRLWAECMPGLVEEGRLITPKEVLIELERKAGKDDGLYEWVKGLGDAVIDFDDDFLLEGKRIINAHPRLLEQKPGRNGADPWVVALAKMKGAAVVTKEGISQNPSKPKIPNVCHAEGIKSMGVLEMIRAEKWVFR